MFCVNVRIVLKQISLARSRFFVAAAARQQRAECLTVRYRDPRPGFRFRSTIQSSKCPRKLCCKRLSRGKI